MHQEKICQQTGKKFTITDQEQELYAKVAPVLDGKTFPIPLPEISPLARQQKRLAFRNEMSLYKRKCDLTGQDIISTYHENVPFPVYSQEAFWSDKWNALDYGRDIDFNRPFFEQYQELMNVVPRLSLINKQSENSEYCNYSFANKNCYLTFGSHYEEDCMYGRYSTKNKNCLDYFWLYNSELTYECTFSDNCYKSVHLDRCSSCTDCYFGFDLKGCKDCLFSSNLRNKQYYIFNKPYSKAEYEEYFAKLQLSSYEKFKELEAKWKKYKEENAIYRASYQVNCENCEGPNHQNSKDLKYCFNCTGCEDCMYGFQMDQTNTSIDCSHTGYDKCELTYNGIGINGVFHCICVDSCWHSSGLLYCTSCFTSKNCFGCTGLQQKEYCILNKQYSKEEYEKLSAKLAEHMQQTGEWGQFFPYQIHPYAYNETVAQEFFPLNKAEALKLGAKWQEDEASNEKKPMDIPDNIKDVTSSICDQPLCCTVTGKMYKITNQELSFYQNMNIPLPRKHPNQRLLERQSLAAQMQFYYRNCHKCGTKLVSSLSPEGPKHIYCEKCYLEEVY